MYLRLKQFDHRKKPQSNAPVATPRPVVKARPDYTLLRWIAQKQEEKWREVLAEWRAERKAK